jgi:hypothetical protein
MRSAIALSAVATSLLVVPIAGFTSANSSAASVTAHPATATLKCRSQTYTYVRGRKPLFSSTAGPHVRSSANGAVTLSDNRVTATYTAVNAGVHDPFVNVLPVNPQVTRLESVTVYPVKGKHKRYKIVANSNRDFAYKYDLIKDYGQVLLPVSGNQGARTTPVMKKVVVTAKENCFTSQ